MTHLTEKPDMLAVWISAARSCSVKDEGTASTQSDTLSCSYANAPQASQSKWTAGAAPSGIADLRTPEKFSVCSSTCCSILLHTSSGATSSSAASSSSCHGQPRRAHQFQVLCLSHSMDPRALLTCRSPLRPLMSTCPGQALTLAQSRPAMADLAASCT